MKNEKNDEKNVRKPFESLPWKHLFRRGSSFWSAKNKSPSETWQNHL